MKTSASADVPFAILVRATVAYDPQEDRIRLDGLCDDEKTLQLWLTARLLNALVSHLVQYTEPIGRSSHRIDESPARLTDSTEVICDSNTVGTLVTAVDVKLQKAQVVLIFKDASGSAGVIFGLQFQGLANWLGMLKICYDQAGWSTLAFQRRSEADQTRAEASITVH